MEVAQALEAVNPWGYAVATADEGIVLREVIADRPVVVLRPPRPAMRAIYELYGLRPVVESIDAGAKWDVPFHVEIDTGMARTGVRWDDYESLTTLGQHRPEGAFTHLYAADEKPETIPLQSKRFQHAIAAMAYQPPLLHVANSAGVPKVSRALDLIRPGIYLYGGQASPDLPPAIPVVSVKAEIVSVRQVGNGESVSYGGDWQAHQDTTIATLSIGYADGIPRSLASRGQVLINGRRRPIVGRVTMDMMMVDLGPGVSSAQVGDVAVLIGGEHPEKITIDEFAGWADTISYEVLTGLGSRLPRRYISAISAV
jgi:alanine racemase